MNWWNEGKRKIRKSKSKTYSFFFFNFTKFFQKKKDQLQCMLCFHGIFEEKKTVWKTRNFFSLKKKIVKPVLLKAIAFTKFLRKKCEREFFCNFHTVKKTMHSSRRLFHSFLWFHGILSSRKIEYSIVSCFFWNFFETEKDRWFDVIILCFHDILAGYKTIDCFRCIQWFHEIFGKMSPNFAYFLFLLRHCKN